MSECGSTPPSEGVVKPHQTVPVQVWVDIDIGIADLVRYLNTLEGVRTHSSCQGTIGEGGANPYEAYIMISWSNEEVLKQLQSLFDVNMIEGDGNLGYI